MKNNITKNLKKFLDFGTPQERMINSKGLNDTFDYLKSNYNFFKVHEFHNGEYVEDWEVPKSWKVIKGQMKDKNNNIIASIKDSILFVAPYSESVKGWFSKNEIIKHLRTRKDKPNDYLLEHRNAYDYNLKTWGITLPFNIWSNLNDDEYFIDIEVEWSNDSMKVGEIFLKGSSKETICFTAHIDELCNDDLSGCAVGLELFEILKTIPNLKYSYQLLLLPELFGPIFYLNQNREKIKNYLGMINLETVGAGENLCIKKSLNKDFYLEHLIKLSLNNLKKKHKELNFFEGYLNDEKIFSWPTINVDSIALQRYPFNEYHTSSDNVNLINYDYLIEIIKILEYFVYVLEHDYIPSYINFMPPWLTKRNLYFDKVTRPDLDRNKLNNELLYAIDGNLKLSEICTKYNLDFKETFNFIDLFIKQKLIKKD